MEIKVMGWIKDKTTQIVATIALFIVASPNLIAIKYAIYTPDDFRLACGENLAGNGVSILFGTLVNPMRNLNYGMLRGVMTGLFLFFILSFLWFAYSLLVNFEICSKKAFTFSSFIVGSFLFFKEYYELFFWWTGAIFYELPISLILCFLSLYLLGKKKNLRALKIIAIIGVAVIVFANCNVGTFDWLKNNEEEDLSFLKSIYYTICVVESECKNYLKNTGMLLGLGCIFAYVLKTDGIAFNINVVKKRLWYIVLPFVSVWPLVYPRNIYNIDRLPNRGEALIDIFLVVYLYLIAIGAGVYIKTKIEKPSHIYMNIVYVFICLCALVFAVNLKNTSDVKIAKNIITKQIQEYSDTWSSIYYVCDTTDESDLVIETSVADRVEGCCYPKLRSNTSSDKNEIVARFFGLNSISLNNTYDD